VLVSFTIEQVARQTPGQMVWSPCSSLSPGTLTRATANSYLCFIGTVTVRANGGLKNLGGKSVDLIVAHSCVGTDPACPVRSVTDTYTVVLDANQRANFVVALADTPKRPGTNTPQAFDVFNLAMPVQLQARYDGNTAATVSCTFNLYPRNSLGLPATDPRHAAFVDQCE
jgi:hypothetical protein